MKRLYPSLQMFDVLEPRTVLNGANASFLPYSLLAIHGKYQAGAQIEVTFQSGKRSITVPPSEVTPTSITVAIPAFFDAKTGAPAPAKVDVFVAQTPEGGKAHSTRAFHNFPIAVLPQTGLPAGSLARELAIDGQVLLADSLRNGFVGVNAPQGNNAVLAVQNLENLANALSSLVYASDLLSSGTVSSVPLGTYSGQPASLDASTFALADRVIAAVADDPTGYTPHAAPLQGPALTARLDGLIQSAVSQGAPGLIQMATRFLDVLGSIPGTKGLPAGAFVAGLTVGDALAMTAVAEAEAGVASTRTTPADPEQVDRFLNSPAIPPGYELILEGLVPNGPAGQAVVAAAQANRALATTLRLVPG